MNRAVGDLLSGFSSTLKDVVAASINQEFENCQIFHPLPDGVILSEQTVFWLDVVVNCSLYKRNEYSFLL